MTKKFPDITRLQDTRLIYSSLSLLYILAMSKWYFKLKTCYYWYYHPQNEILSFKSNKICTNSMWEKNNKTLMEDTKDLNKWKDIPRSWIRRLNTVKMSVLPSLTYSFNTNLNQNHGKLFLWILKFIQKCKQPRIPNSILKENKMRGLTLPNFKTYCKATVIKMV